MEQHEIKEALRQAITEVWATDEIRRLSPTPLDEAKTGFVAVGAFSVACNSRSDKGTQSGDTGQDREAPSL